MPDSYHHGDLQAQVLAHAAAMIARDGAEAFSLRRVAAELGVSHTAPRHHFGNREGLFTALAEQGYELLGEALAAASPRGFAEVGAAYVEFAVSHPGHFAVMHRPDLVDADHPGLRRASRRTAEQLSGGVGHLVGGGPEQVAVAAVAAWALVHGIATLTLDGALDDLTAQAGRATGTTWWCAPRASCTSPRTSWSPPMTLSGPDLTTAGVVLLAVVTIAYGGTFVLRVVTGGQPANRLQKDFFRAGHAHAGVLVILGLVVLLLTSSPGVPAWAGTGGTAVLWAAVLMPAGFFLSVLGKDPQRPSKLIVLLWLGAAALTAGLVCAGVGLILAGGTA